MLSSEVSIAFGMVALMCMSGAARGAVEVEVLDDAGVGLVVVEGEDVVDHTEDPRAARKHVPDFEPTKEWKDILPDQAVPPGLHVRLNLSTGRRQARLLDEMHLPAANLERLARAELITTLKKNGVLAKFKPTMVDIADRSKLEDAAEIFCAVNEIEEEYCGQAIVDETRRDFGLGAKLHVEQGLSVYVGGGEHLFKPSMEEVEQDELLLAAAQKFCDEHSSSEEAASGGCAQSVYDQARVEFGFTASEKRNRRKPLWRCSLTDPTKPCEPGAGMDPNAVAPMSLQTGKSKKDILLQLPSPDPELEKALDMRKKGSKLSDEQMQEIIDRVWSRRQEQLEEAMKNVKTAAQSMTALKDKILDKETPVAERIQTLTDLEWYVQDIDNAGDLHAIGGFDAVISQLDDEEPMVAATAAWVVGSAVKNHPKTQYQALELGVMPALLKLVSSGLQPDAGRAEVHCAGKGLYAVSALIRSNAATQEAFRLNKGLSALELAFAIEMDKVEKASSPAVAKLQATLQRKSIALVGDLLRGANNVRDSDLALKAELHSPPWCANMAGLLQRGVSEAGGRQTAEETLSTSLLMLEEAAASVGSGAGGAATVKEIEAEAKEEIGLLQHRVKALLQEALTLKRSGDIDAAKRELAAVAALRERLTDLQRPEFAAEEAVRVATLAASRLESATGCRAAFGVSALQSALAAAEARWKAEDRKWREEEQDEEGDEFALELAATAAALRRRISAPETVDDDDI